MTVLSSTPGVLSFLINLVNTPQSFLITLAGVQYTLVVKWNDEDDGGWFMDIQDSNQVPIACNIPFIVGADLLNGLGYLEIGGSFYLYNALSPDSPPTFDNLGTDSNLYFLTVNPNE